MNRTFNSFIRGFSFYQFLMPNKFYLYEKDVQDILERDMFYIQKDMDNVEKEEG